MAFDDADVQIYMVELSEKDLKDDAFERINQAEIPFAPAQ